MGELAETPFSVMTGPPADTAEADEEESSMCNNVWLELARRFRNTGDSIVARQENKEKIPGQVAITCRVPQTTRVHVEEESERKR